MERPETRPGWIVSQARRVPTIGLLRSYPTARNISAVVPSNNRGTSPGHAAHGWATLLAVVVIWLPCGRNQLRVNGRLDYKSL